MPAVAAPNSKFGERNGSITMSVSPNKTLPSGSEDFDTEEEEVQIQMRSTMYKDKHPRERKLASMQHMYADNKSNRLSGHSLADSSTNIGDIRINVKKKQNPNQQRRNRLAMLKRMQRQKQNPAQGQKVIHINSSEPQLIP